MPRRYDYAALHDAYFAMVEDKMSISDAARHFRIPRKTLADRMNGNTGVQRMGRGPTPLFSEEQELALTQYPRKMAGFGYGYSRAEVLELASSMQRVLASP